MFPGVLRFLRIMKPQDVNMICFVVTAYLYSSVVGPKLAEDYLHAYLICRISICIYISSNFIFMYVCVFTYTHE